MIEYDFEGYAKSKIDKGLGYLEGFSKGYHQAKSEWVGLTGEEIWEAYMESPVELDCSADELYVISQIIEAKLKDKNT